MRPCWMLPPLLLLGCTLIGAARPPITCEDAASGAGVLVPCPNATGDEGNFILLRDEQIVCTYEWRRQTDAQGTMAPRPVFDVKLHSSEDGKVEGFVLAAAASQSAGTYKCKSAVTFPPPLKMIMGSPITLPLARGRQCDDRKNQSDSGGGGAGGGEAEGGQGSLWAWMTAVALLATYSLIVTVLAVVSLRNTRSTDSYSDYMNTKPRERRRPQGIQMPVPRHF